MTHAEWKRQILEREPSGLLISPEGLERLCRDLAVREAGPTIYADRHCATCRRCTMALEFAGFYCVQCAGENWVWLDEPVPAAEARMRALYAVPYERQAAPVAVWLVWALAVLVGLVIAWRAM